MLSSDFVFVHSSLIYSSHVYKGFVIDLVLIWLLMQIAVNALHELQQGWNATPGLAENWTWGSDPCWNQWIGVDCFQESVVSL